MSGSPEAARERSAPVRSGSLRRLSLASGPEGLALLAVAFCGGALVPNDGVAQTGAVGERMEALERALAERDAVIVQLLQRVDALEARTGAEGGPAAAPAAVPAVPAASPPPPPPEPTATAEAPPAEPGAFEVDEDAVERALERALVLEGAQLLPPGVAQIQPSLSYARRETTAPVLLRAGDEVVVGETETERDVIQAELALRAGLPFDSQIEIGLPYRFDDDTTVTRAGFEPLGASSDSVTGFGDINLSLTKALLRERGSLPSLFASAEWDTDTGQSKDGRPLGSGFHELGFELTAVKSQDPLVFIGGLIYEHAFEDGGIQPGDRYGASIGAALAASPETSLRFELSQIFQDETEVGGRSIDGTDRTSAIFSVGASSVLSRRAFLDVEVGIGLTDDAPDYTVGVSLPIRFDLPLP